jgi:son of sevenless-like protein
VLSFFADINLARTVDVDGIGREGHSGDVYLQSVHKARTSARTFEAQLQSLFDDGSSVLLAITTPASLQSSPTSIPSERLRSLVASLKINVAQAFQTLEALLAVGQEQVAKGPSDHRGSIEWRMSRIVNIDSNFERTLKELASEDESYDEGGEDYVDMEHAFARKPAPLRPSGSLGRSQSASAMYSNPSQTSESSLEPPQVHSEDGTRLPIYPNNHMSAIPSPPSLPGSDAAAGSLEDEGMNDHTVSPPLSNGVMGFPDTTSPTSSNGKAPAGAADKLLRVLGDAPTHIIDKLNAKTKPWYLRPNYEDSEIQMDPDGKVRAGTVPALVERLTAHEHSGAPYDVASMVAEADYNI